MISIYICLFTCSFFIVIYYILSYLDYIYCIYIIYNITFYFLFIYLLLRIAVSINACRNIIIHIFFFNLIQYLFHIISFKKNFITSS